MNRIPDKIGEKKENDKCSEPWKGSILIALGETRRKEKRQMYQNPGRVQYE